MRSSRKYQAIRYAAALSGIMLLSAAMPANAPSKYTRATLPNGLRVIVAEDHAAPVVAVAVSYDVGSRNERQGRTGFAHLFEHMMFKGSENVGQGEHPYLIFMNGGTMNGTTNKDRTLYYEALPANQMNLALFLEADRMRSLAITQANLDNQRSAVQEERRSRVDNVPYGRTGEVLPQMAYKNFAYAHSVIGSMDDLSAATVEDVASFFRTYYAPNNAVLTIVGDVDAKAAIAAARKYFGAIPRQAAPPAVDMSEPAQTEERRATLEDPLARATQLDMAYKMPPSNSPDFDALSVLATTMAGGRSSRFYDAVVRKKPLATSISADASESRGPGLFQITATAAPGVTVADLEAALTAEITRIQTEPVADWEMEKARTSARRANVAMRGSVLQRATSMAEDAQFYGDPDRTAGRADRIDRLTPADIRRVAQQYLVPSNRAVVITMPKAPANAGGAR